MSRQSEFLGALIIGAVLVSGCLASAPTEAPEAVKSATDAYLAYERGDCTQVAQSTNLERVESWEAGEARDSVFLLRGFCQELAGRVDDAIATYRGLVHNAPLSFASDDARERMRILRLFQRDPEYKAWVEAARKRATTGSTTRVPVDRVEADFPPLPRQAGIEGFAVVEFGVTPRGDTDAPVIVDSKPPLLFDGAALRAVRDWRYTRDPGGSESKRQAIRIIFQPRNDALSPPGS